jgi:hypothetical protein
MPATKNKAFAIPGGPFLGLHCWARGARPCVAAAAGFGHSLRGRAQSDGAVGGVDKKNACHIIEAGVAASVGAAVSINGAVRSPNGAPVNASCRPCNASCSAESWYNAAISNPNGCTLRLPDRLDTLKVFSALECLMKAVERRPEFADAWIKIGEAQWIAASRRHGFRPHGQERAVGRGEGIPAAMLVDEGRAEAWHGLAAALEDEER